MSLISQVESRFEGIAHPKRLATGRMEHFRLVAHDNFVNRKPLRPADQNEVGELSSFTGPKVAV